MHATTGRNATLSHAGNKHAFFRVSCVVLSGALMSLSVLVGSIALTSGPAGATPSITCTWHPSDPISGVYDISDNDNWTASGGVCGSGTGQGTAALSGTELIFPESEAGSGLPTLDSSLSVDDLVFTGSTSGVTFALMTSSSSNVLTVDPVNNGGVGITDSNTGATVDIEADLALGENQTFSVTAGDATLEVNGVVSGGETLTTAGPGGVILSAVNTYSGATTVSSGTLVVTDSVADSAVTVADGATLEGTGVVASLTANSSSTVAPGSSSTHLGTLSSADGATLTDSVFDVALGGTSTGNFSQLDVTAGSINVTGATLSLSFSGFTPSRGQTFDILENGANEAITGVFAGLAQGETFAVDGQTFEISYLGGTGHDVVLTDEGSGSAPTVVTGVASSVTSDSATLNGTVNPNDPNDTLDTRYYFEYGTNLDYNSGETATTYVGYGTSALAAAAAVTGLSSDTIYYFQLVGTNTEGTTYGGAGTFTTSVSYGSAPTVATGAASSVTSSSATLNGTVDPNDPDNLLDTTYYFEYGTNLAYSSGDTTVTSAGYGTTAVGAAAAITGLSPDTTYDFQLVGSNAYGTTVGGNGTFTTSVAVAKTTTTLKLRRAKVDYGKETEERLNVKVSAQSGVLSPTGQVSMKEASKTLCVITLSSRSGSCVLSAKQLKVGTYDIVASYGGATNFVASNSGSVTLSVIKP
jgi:autotransporter-associated beta strand protein